MCLTLKDGSKDILMFPESSQSVPQSFFMQTRDGSSTLSAYKPKKAKNAKRVGNNEAQGLPELS